MRVTKNMMVSSLLDSLQKAEQRNSRNQKELSTGIRVAQPSDNPADASRILSLRTRLAGIEQQQSNIDHITHWTSQTSSILQSVHDLFLRAQELAQRGGDETLTVTQKTEMAAEVDELLETLVNHANEKNGRYYTFGGNHIDSAPYVVTRDANGEIDTVTLDTQTGIGVQRSIEVLDGQTEAVNETGASTFTTSGGIDLFNVLRDLRDNLRTGDMAAIGSSFNEVKDTLAHVNVKLDRVGSRERWLQAVQTRLDEAALYYTEKKAGYEEADLTEAVLNLQRDQTAYQAALQAGATSMQLSLMHFLQ